MKDLLLAAVEDQPDPLRRRNRAREFLQGRILLSLQDQGAFADWAFVGGTCLRFLYQLPRFSEDLDFSLIAPGRDVRYNHYIRGVKADLIADAYDVVARVKEQKTVASAMIKFRGLPYDIGLSPHRDEVFSVKIEVDTNPPTGAVVATRTIRRDFLVRLAHYDQASLLAGKIHAVLTRKYTKGRDLYDLAWYLSDPTWPSPNLTLLNHALRQTGWKGASLSNANWRPALGTRLSRCDWKQARLDVVPFLERPRDEEFLSSAIFSDLLNYPVADS